MSRITVTRTIGAPSETVFETVADIRQFSKALPHVVKYEFLSEVQSGVGTRFRETRLMNGKEATTQLEVTEFVESDLVRLVAETRMGPFGTRCSPSKLTTVYRPDDDDGRETL